MQLKTLACGALIFCFLPDIYLYEDIIILVLLAVIFECISYSKLDLPKTVFDFSLAVLVVFGFQIYLS